MNWEELAIKIAVGIVVGLLSFFGSWLLAKIKTWLSTKIKNAKFAASLDKALDIVVSAVKCTKQTYVDGIKGTSAWTIDAQKAALSNAVNTAKEQMSKDVRTFIEKTYGDVDAWLTTQVEATLCDIKKK